MKDKAIQIENLSVYYGETPALTGVCLDIGISEYLGIIGPNGGGKSTLLKAILGLVPISTGRIKIYDHGDKRKEVIGYVPQYTSFDKRFPITLLEVVMTARLRNGLSPFFRFGPKDMEMAYELIEKVGLKGLENRQISELSGGEFQKMLIARALTLKPRILLLDEPTANVDENARGQIYNLLAELNKDITIVLVTHDLFAVSSQVEKLACINGKLIYHGEPELSENIVNRLYGCPVDLIAHGVPHRVLRRH